MGKTIGYLRVSTGRQDLEKNKADILQFSNEKGLGRVQWVEEKVSGVKDWRQRELGKVVEGLKHGDTLVVAELSRLGRSLFQILEVIKILKERNVSVYALKGGWQLDSSMNSKIVLAMLGMISEVERDLLSERVKEALRARKLRGIRLGRPPGPGKSKLDQHRPEIEALLKTGSLRVYIASRYGATPGTLTNWIKKNRISAKPDLAAPVKVEDKREPARAVRRGR